MKYSWLDQYCQSKKSAIREFKEEWNATKYMVGGKMFALQGTDNTGKAIITLKLEPDYGDFLRTQYEDIVPGYYMNKFHWNSVYLDGSVPDDLLKDMIDKSYDIIFESLSKKIKQEIAG